MFVVYVHVSLYTPLGWSIVLRPDKPAWVVLVAYVRIRFHSKVAFKFPAWNSVYYRGSLMLRLFCGLASLSWCIYFLAAREAN